MHGVEQDISVTRKHFGKNAIFKTASPVYNPQGVLAPGTQFSIPFAFVLPTHLPPSFSAEGGNTGQQWSCFIAYAVKAVCHTCDGQLPLKHSQHIHITSERSAGVHVHHPITREQTRAVTTCCCFPQGSTGLQITVDKSAYVMGEEVAVVAQVDNRNSRQRFSALNMQGHKTPNPRGNSCRGDGSCSLLSLCRRRWPSRTRSSSSRSRSSRPRASRLPQPPPSRQPP